MRIPFIFHFCNYGSAIWLIYILWNRLDAEATPVSSHPPSPSPTPTPSGSLIPPRDSEPVYSPYTDDPEAQGGYDPNVMLQTQRHMMDGKATSFEQNFVTAVGLTSLPMTDQDNQLSHLSTSLNRQHTLSEAINSELEVHHGLLEELDTDLEGTQSRLGGARRRLDRVAKGVRGNGT